MQGREVDFFEVDVGQGRHWQLERFGAGRQCRCVLGNGVRRQILGLQLLEPSVFVGCENGVRVAGQGEHFLSLENHMVFVGVQGNASVGQGTAHLGIAGQGGRFVVVIGKDGLCLNLLGQMRNFLDGITVQHNQTHLGGCFGVKPCLLGGLAQQLVQFDQRSLNEGDPAVFSGQLVQDAGVKDKHALHFVAVFEGVKQGRVVGNA